MEDKKFSSQRCRKQKYNVGDCVSVPPIYFGVQYSSCIPSQITKIYGRVVYVLDGSLRVKWDVDGTVATVKNEKVIIEENSLPPQVIQEYEDSVEESDKEEEVNKENVIDEQEKVMSKKVRKKKDEDDIDMEIEKGEEKPVIKKLELRETTKRLINVVDDEDDIENDENVNFLKRKLDKRLTAKKKKVVDEKENVNHKKKTKFDLKINIKEKSVKKLLLKPSTSKESEPDVSDEEDDDNEMLDYSSDSNSDLDDDEEIEEGQTMSNDKILWKKSNWDVDPRNNSQGYGPRLSNNVVDFGCELDVLLHFLPKEYIKTVLLPATNTTALKDDPKWQDVSFPEFVNFLGLMYSMEIYRLPERRMYWATQNVGVFACLNFGQYMTRDRFEKIIKYLQLSNDNDRNRQFTHFLEAVNKTLRTAIVPGDVLCIDESMVKAFHKKLKAKKKVKRKPRPIGNEFHALCDGRSKIVLNLELYEDKEANKEREYAKELGVTTATTLRLTKPWKSSGRVVVGDSWFGSVKSVVNLKVKNGLYGVMLVKTAYKHYPSEQLEKSKKLKRGQWTSVSSRVDGVSLLATKFLDLKDKQFISSCYTDLPGNPRKTKHHGDVDRPHLAEMYLKYAAGIDIFNHFRTGSCGLEDVWLTKDPIHRQFSGIVGFLLTNAYLAYNYFMHDSTKHMDFKIQLSHQMVHYAPKERAALRDRPQNINTLEEVSNIHSLKKLSEKNLRKQARCYYCKHKRENGPRVLTSYYCSIEGIKRPLCSPTTGRDCFEQHILHGMPSKGEWKK